MLRLVNAAVLTNEQAHPYFQLRVASIFSNGR
jgi:hypothetical protein